MLLGLALSWALTQPVFAGSTSPISARCFVKSKDGPEYVGDRRCLSFDPPGRFKGIWINEFEGSNFVPGGREISDVKPSLKHIWLATDRQTSMPQGMTAEQGHAYLVTFIGIPAHHRTVRLGDGFGHLGMSTGLVLADRFVSMTDLGLVREGIGWPPIRQVR